MSIVQGTQVRARFGSGGMIMTDFSKQFFARWQRAGYGGRFGRQVQIHRRLVKRETGFGSRVVMVILQEWIRGATAGKRGLNKIMARSRAKKAARKVMFWVMMMTMMKRKQN